MSYLTWKQRLRMPTYDNPAHARSGWVAVDHDRCNGCGMCALICPGNSLYLAGAGKDKKACINEMKEGFSTCFSCNDCAAICERDAITATRGYDFGYHFKQLHKEELAPPRNF